MKLLRNEVRLRRMKHSFVSMHHSQAQEDEQIRRGIEHGVAEKGREKIGERHNQTDGGGVAHVLAAEPRFEIDGNKAADIEQRGGDAEKGGVLQVLVVRAVIDVQRFFLEAGRDSLHAPAEERALFDIAERQAPQTPPARAGAVGGRSEGRPFGGVGNRAEYRFDIGKEIKF